MTDKKKPSKFIKPQIYEIVRSTTENLNLIEILPKSPVNTHKISKLIEIYDKSPESKSKPMNPFGNNLKAHSMTPLCCKKIRTTLISSFNNQTPKIFI